MDRVTKFISGKVSVRQIVRFGGLMVGFIFAWMGLRGLTTFDTSWDTVAYHLPFAMVDFDLTTFKFPEGPGHPYYLWYQGLPPVMHWLVGLGIKYTGYLQLVSCVNTVALALLIAALRKAYGTKISLGGFILALGNVPLVYFHLPSGYDDLWTGCFLAIALVGIDIYPRNWAWAITFASVGLFVADGTKYVALPISALAVAWLTLKIWNRRSFDRKSMLGLIFVVIGASFWPLRNCVLFGNPTHPFRPPLISRFIKSYARDTSDSTELDTPKYFWNVPRPLTYLASVLEIPRLIQPPKSGFDWSIDATGDTIYTKRMGGWGWKSSLLFIIFLGWLFRTRHESTNGLRNFLAVAFVSVSVIPQSHELRYWLAIPILAAICFARWCAGSHGRRAIWVPILFVIVTYSNVRKIRGFIFRRPSFARAEDVAPAEAKEFWKNCPKDRVSCVTDKQQMTFYYAGPKFNTCPIRDCTISTPVSGIE